MDRVFLDANVLFSAAYSEDADFQRLWQLPDVELIISTYAVEEVLRNLRHQVQLDRLDRLLEAMRLVSTWDHISLPDDIVLPADDIPILQAAVAVEATHLLTGDFGDFGPYFDMTVAGVLILKPAVYLQRVTN